MQMLRWFNARELIRGNYYQIRVLKKRITEKLKDGRIKTVGWVQHFNRDGKPIKVLIFKSKVIKPHEM